MFSQFKIFFTVILFTATFLSAQNSTLSGFITDSETGEELISANIYVIELETGTTSNEYGFYSITIPKGEYTIRFSYTGYKKETTTINLKLSVSTNIGLVPDSYEISEVVVQGKKDDHNVTSTEMGTTEINPKEMQSVPVILGEADILKTMQLLPGVSQAGDGSSGYFVRGGNIDQNLILLDEATVYNPSHLFGFFSVFNSDAIKNVNLIKGGFPARFGGRLSSVLELNMKEGNNKEFQGQASIGLISSKLTMEGPIVIDKTSFILSGRRTYVDILMQPFLPDDEKGGYYFYDLNAKVNHIFSKTDRIYLSMYSGDDIFYATNNSNSFGGNR